MKTKEKGITLVALVITVIVLLILAGVAISAITSGEGLFGKTKEAADKYNNASKNESEQMNELINEIEDYKKKVKIQVNMPDTSKLPISTTKYVTWTGEDVYTEVLSDTVPNNWYDYKENKWANIKTTSTDKSLEAYWVWIPRFAYKLPESSTAKTIEVAFAKGNGTTVVNPETGEEQQAYYSTDSEITTNNLGLYVDSTDKAKGINGEEQAWILHPAFSFGNSAKLNENVQLSGIWVAKYEASSSNPSNANGGGNVTTLKVQVKPNTTSWRSISSTNSFIVCREIQNEGGVLGTVTGTATVDTHMIKSIEWGAVAILSQSKYGNYDKVTNTNNQVWNNPNSSYITGSASKTENAKDVSNIADASCDRYNVGNGPKASTTGNIYGVYDMAGGSWEQVAGVYLKATTLGNPDAKYYDLYTNPKNTYKNYEGGKIGDLTGECTPIEQATWNGDRAYFVNSDYTLLYRGGYKGFTTSAGIFTFSYDNGGVSADHSFRPVLILL